MPSDRLGQQRAATAGHGRPFVKDSETLEHDLLTCFRHQETFCGLYLPGRYLDCFK